MILDTSAIVAIVLNEPGAEDLIEAARATPVLAVAAPSLAEAGIVLQSRLQVEGQGLLDRFLRDFEVIVLSFSDRHWREAVDAYRRYGKGFHPAALNFGDCMSYAAAKVTGQPLLYVGNDFARTDLAGPG
ncbi:MAG TPA: type II toxin-antitoxin system VapC family toxin [Thermoanaerobaculia bacterium]|nr:type II toxin-antitoxin system VapC family toxin [Thermoanaerobaculia bacterium]